MIRLIPRFVIKKAIVFHLEAIQIENSHFCVICLATFVVPSMFQMAHGSGNQIVGRWSHATVLGSIKFSVAPLLTKADLVSRVVSSTNHIFIAFLLNKYMDRTRSAHAAIASKGKSKNLKAC